MREWAGGNYDPARVDQAAASTAVSKLTFPEQGRQRG